MTTLRRLFRRLHPHRFTVDQLVHAMEMAWEEGHMAACINPDEKNPYTLNGEGQ